jgi:predicted peptidase
VRVALLLGLVFLLVSAAADDTGRFVEHSVRLPSGAVTRFAVWLPPGFTPTRYWPAVVFLHGEAESGEDNARQTQIGLGPVLRERPAFWPAVVIFPQKPDPKVLWSAREDLVLAVLAAARGSYPIDVSRIYLTGLSQGGEGTWDIAAKNPGKFAALVPVSGWSEDPDGAARALGATPVWLFHGVADTVVPAGRAQRIAAAVQKEGHAPRLTFYGKLGHDVWDRAYRTRNLPKWLLRKHLPKTGD